MTCPICKKGEFSESTTTVTLERDDSTVVFKAVPARVCQTCGEAFVDEETTSTLLDDLKQATNSGVEIEVRDLDRRAAG